MEEGYNADFRPRETSRSAISVEGQDSNWSFLTGISSEIETVQEQLFVKVITNRTSLGGRHVQVEVGRPNAIVSVYLLLYGPIIMAWVAYYHYGEKPEHYALLLPLTLCTMIIGFDLVNQALSMLMKAPMVISAVQSIGCICICSLWAFVSPSRQKQDPAETIHHLARWTVVAICFGFYQVVNHAVSLYCSLSERTMFTNLCPVFTLLFESTLMSGSLRARVTFRSKMALATMVMGAFLFSIQYPDFTREGVVAAGSMIFVLVPYRLLQRSFLGECLSVPVSILGAFDGFFLLIPALIISIVDQQDHWEEWNTWMHHPSVVLMLALSIFSFTANHICGLLMLQLGSATYFLIFQNTACFMVVGLGISVFGDNVSSPLVVVGIMICLFGGLWYAIEAKRANETDSPSPSKGKLEELRLNEKLQAACDENNIDPVEALRK
jgi:hypothetical protein